MISKQQKGDFSEQTPYLVAVTMTQDQAYIMRRALESYARMLSGQIDIAMEELHFTYSGDWHSDVGPKIKELTDRIFFETDIRKKLTDKSSTAWDMMQVIRYVQSWHDNPSGGIQVCFDTPLRSSPHPLIKCQIVDEA